ncbi:serine protease, S1-C subfamily, contains C-terminal PDZ domain [Streptomyces sp. DvalAA-14]|uniref:S1C family serine protease n=1 Tax=unclassified Streptomyces TaxID=2593676 RepID=UPI00081B6C45|nr:MULTISPECIES: trypsin-like peptidase domain-containing protein [unclassified Streptomyces]MYS23726.1 trypsin-like serine protease [Streptomyces sp. SID4948]SCE37835.1 serine protease, S1-C subfamily, contains C-terminal PDZ domain [Streptomyces sp. DvalAA-14]
MSGSHPSRTRILLAGAAALCATALLATGCSPASDTGAAGSSTGHPAGHAAAQAAVAASSGGNGLQNAYQDEVRNVLPSVVQITTNTDLGSGVVFDSKGDIVTNAHVVGKAKSFQVSVATGGKALGAKLISTFPANDLAVIRLTSLPNNLKPATFADSSKVAVGQIVLAMGNPLGLSGSVTEGIVSATGRTVSESEGQSNSTGATIPDLIQTSAAINPGNSGGALVNLDNQVIGIPTLAATDPQLGSGAAPGIGFAIPSSTVTMIANQIIRNGKVTNSGRAALGVTVRGVVGKNFEPAGAAIVSVQKNGAAAAAGLRAGDVITKLGNTVIGTVQSLTDALARLKPHQKVRLEFGRGNTGHATEVTLGTL